LNMGSLKRPLAVTGFSMLLTVLCIILTDCTALAVFAVGFAGVCLVSAVALKFKGADTLFAVSVGIIVASLLLLNGWYRHDKALTFCGKDRYVEAFVSSEAKYSEKRDRFYLEASVKTVDSEKSYGKIRLSFPNSADGVHKNLKIGDRIYFRADIYKIGSDSENIHNSFSSEKIYLGAYSVNVLSVNQPTVRPLTYYAAMLRNKISSILKANYPDEISGLLNAILTGDKSECPYWVYLNFKRSGTAHVMAVSGLHLSVWLSVLFCALKSSEKTRKLRFLIGFIFVIFFVFIADFSPSVCRAALMSTLYLFGTLLRKRADPLNSVGFALICILCANPYAAHSVSFQLSFACVLSIIVIASPLCNSLKPKLKRVIKNKWLLRAVHSALSCIIISLTISVVTFPICSYHFSYVSLVSPLTNLFIIPACAPLMVSTVLFLFFSGVPFASELFGISTDILSKYMLFVTEDFSSLEFSAIPTDMREKLLWIVGIAALSVLVILKRANRKAMLRAASVLIVILTAFSLFAVLDKKTEECRLKVINTEVGSAAVLICNGKGILLGATGDYYFSDTLIDVVEAENIDLVAAVPVAEKDKEELEIICVDFEIENLLSCGESAEFFGDAHISVMENGAEIIVKGKSMGVFPSDGLQLSEYYDIIIRDDGVIMLEDGETVSCEKQGHSMTVYISEKKDIQVWREELWLNLTKKS